MYTVSLLPPVTVVGYNTNDRTEADGFTVRFAVADPLFADAVRVTLAGLDTADTAAVTLALEDPAGIVTLREATTAGAELVTVAVIPPAGAVPSNVTVMLTLPPPVAGFGVAVTETTFGKGVTVNSAVAVPLYEPVTVTGVLTVTTDVGTLNV
jgi:hypothetical protein